MYVMFALYETETEYSYRYAWDCKTYETTTAKAWLCIQKHVEHTEEQRWNGYGEESEEEKLESWENICREYICSVPEVCQMHYQARQQL